MQAKIDAEIRDVTERLATLENSYPGIESRHRKLWDDEAVAWGPDKDRKRKAPKKPAEHAALMKQIIASQVTLFKTIDNIDALKARLAKLQSTEEVETAVAQAVAKAEERQ